MKVLVTGCAGYVGSILTSRLLAEGNEVTGVDNLSKGNIGLLANLFRENFTFHRIDICDRDAVAPLLRGHDAVVHLAAIVGDPASRKEPELTRRLNLDATRDLVDATMELKSIRRFVFFSTCSNYGMQPGDRLATEESPLQPVSLYAETKVAAERYLLERCAGGFPGTILRCATVYGCSPRMRFDLTVNHFTRDAFADGKLKVYGEEFWRPYIHVEDMANAVLKVFASPAAKVQGQVFNTGKTSENYQKRTIAEVIAKKIPGTRVEFVKVDEDPRNYRVDFSKIEKTLGFIPRFTLADGVDQVLRLLQQKVLADLKDPAYTN